MHLQITTTVRQDYKSVANGFNRELFEKLSPPFPPVKILRFDGSKKGDIISLQLSFIFFRQTWTSMIVEEGQSEEEFYFIDKGTRLPFFLKHWHHQHQILKDGRHTKIVDDIHFRTPSPLLDFLIYPLMWLQFMYRKPIYKKVFG